MNPSNFFSSVLIFLFLNGTFSLANASVIYSYQGNSFNDYEYTNSIAGDYSYLNSVSGFFELSDSLTANTSLFDISSLILDYEFSDGLYDYNSSNSFIYEFYVSTNDTGIDDWTVTINQNGYYSLDNGETTTRLITRTVERFGGTSNVFDQGTAFLCQSTTCDGVVKMKGDIDSGSVRNAGTWTGGVDASANVPEPSIIALFGAGLAGIGFIRRRGYIKNLK